MSLSKIVELFKDKNSFLLCAHHGPEGDSIGSQLGIYHLLKRLGKEVYIYNHDPVPGNLMFLKGAELITAEPPKKEFDAAIAVDCADLSRTGKPREFLEKIQPLINIDHHVSNTEFGTVNYVDPHASSASEMVLRIYQEIFGDDVDLNAAEAIYAGICTDTGSFRFSCTTSEVHTAVALLLKVGVDPDKVSRNIRSAFSSADVIFMGNVLSKLKTENSGRFFWVCIDEWKNDSDGDITDALFYNLQTIKGAEIFVLMKQIKPGVVRINFRSQGTVDVNKVAARFNGGGHAKAAGATVERMGMRQVEEQVITAVKEALRG